MANIVLPPTSSSGNGSIRILIADSHAMFRTALSKLLQAEPGFVVAGEAEDGMEAVAQVRVLHPHVVLLDLALPHFSGLEVLHEIRPFPSLTRALLLVDAIDERELMEALCLGARGVVLKTTPTHLFMKSIRVVNSGEYWVGRSHISLLIRALNERLGNNGQNDCQNLFGLAPCDLDIIRAVAAGESTREVAHMISRSEVTVRHRLTCIYRKLGVHNRGELLSFAMSHNLAGKRDSSLEGTVPTQRSDGVQGSVRPPCPVPAT